MLDSILLGADVAFTTHNLFFAFLGCLLGTAIGVLPGVGPLATIALLLPMTFTLDPVTAIIMLAGIYYGAQYGGSTSAILLNLPGEVSAVVSAIEGHQMARAGRAGVALATAAIASFIAGCFATLVVALAGPAITSVAVSFGPTDYFALVFLGLAVAAVLTRGSVVRSLAMLVLGVALGLVGTDVQTGHARFTFGSPYLIEGIEFVAVAMGIFGVAEIARNLEFPELRGGMLNAVGSMRPSREDVKRAAPSVARGTLVGSFLGVLPGGGLALSTFASYMLERKVSKHRDEFGTGAIEGLAGPESANNAASQTSFIPMLTLGIPANAVMALMVGGLMIHGIQPGPSIMTNQPNLFWGLIVSMWIGNLMLLIINLPMIGIWISMLRIPYKFLYPAILVFCAVGVYSLSYSPFAVFMTAAFGVIGYLFGKLELDVTPLIIGFVLGPLLEEHFRRAMLLSRGDYLAFFNSPLSATLVLLSMVMVGGALVPSLRKRKDQTLVE